MHNKKLLGNYYAHIGQLAFVYRGFTPKPNERKQKGKYLLLGGRNISGGQLIKSSKDAYTDDIPRESFRRAIAKPGDIIVSTLFDKRKLYIFRRSDPQAVVLDSCAIIRTRAVFEGGDDYILSYLRTIKGQEQFLHDAEQATGGEFIPRLSIKDLEAIKVPLLPISDLQRLGDTHIELSTTDELNSLRDELKSKENEVAKLKASNAYLENRLQKIEDERSSKEYALRNRIAHGETSTLEFKSSLRWNFKTMQRDKNLEFAVIREICGFCNSDGGELLIGITDNGDIIGIKDDQFENDDKFLLHLSNLIKDRIVPSIVIQYIDYEIISIDGKRICRVVCKQSRDGVWLKLEQNTQKFYVRTGPSCRELLPMDAVQYIQERFHKGSTSYAGDK